jgi:hypothetical protein
MSINIKPENRGKLHSALGVAKNKPIPTGRLEKEQKKAKSGSALSKEIIFAENARHWNHRGKK